MADRVVPEAPITQINLAASTIPFGPYSKHPKGFFDRTSGSGQTLMMEIWLELAAECSIGFRLNLDKFRDIKLFLSTTYLFFVDK
jgi:hypothetical protein